MRRGVRRGEGSDCGRARLLPSPGSVHAEPAVQRVQSGDVGAAEKKTAKSDASCKLISRNRPWGAGALGELSCAWRRPSPPERLRRWQRGQMPGSEAVPAAAPLPAAGPGLSAAQGRIFFHPITSLWRALR